MFSQYKILKLFAVTIIILLFSVCSVSKIKIERQLSAIYISKQDKEFQLSVDEYRDTDIPLIAQLRDEGIKLYGVKPYGAVLYVKGCGRYFDWDYMTPKFILPRLNVGDFDKDGQQELSVILYVGSGTGYSVEELHIVKTGNKKSFLTERKNEKYHIKPEEFTDFLYDDYIAQLNQLIHLKALQRPEGIAAEITVGNKKYVCPLNLSNGETVKDGLAVGDIVHFDAADSKLTASFALGCVINEYASPLFIGDIIADVELQNGNFKLNNLRFEFE